MAAPSARRRRSRAATFAEYGAGGPPCTLADVDDLPLPRGPEAGQPTLRWREAERRRKMARARLFAWPVATEDAHPVPLPDAVAKTTAPRGSTS